MMTPTITPAVLAAARDQVAPLIDAGALFYASTSGGKDSDAMCILLSQIIPAEQLVYCHADLGRFEHPGVIEHIHSIIAPAELHIARARFADGTPKDFASKLLTHRAGLDSRGKTAAAAWPSSGQRWCTAELKTGPLWRLYHEIAAARGLRPDRPGRRQILVNCVGIRAGESPRRRRQIEKRGALAPNQGQSNGIWEAYDWNPLAHWTACTDAQYDPEAPDVFRAIIEAGHLPHRAYRYDRIANRVLGNERLSCVFCIFGSRGDLRRGAIADPDLLMELTGLETATRGTMFHTQSLAERAGIRIITREHAA